MLYRNLKNIIIAIAALLLWPAAGEAAESALQFHHYQVRSGMPSNCVRDIVQDARGFIWFATDGGLVRFDGRSYKLYALSCPTDGCVEENFIRSLHTAPDGLYAGTDIGLYTYNLRLDRFDYTGLDINGIRQHAPVINIKSDREGNLWISMEDKGVFEIKKATGEVTHFDFPLCNNYIGNIFIDSSNGIWVQSNTGTETLYSFNRSSGEFRPFAVTVGGEKVSTPSYTLLQADNQNLLLGLWNGRLIKFDSLSGKGNYVDAASSSPGLNHIHSMTRHSETDILIGSDAGLTVLNLPSARFTTFRQDELDPSSISDRYVYPIFRDREGGTWIGTFFGGVNYMPPELKNFEKFRHSKYRNSVSGNLISRLCEDTDGNIFIASEDGGLTRLNPRDNSFTTIPITLPDGSPVQNIAALGIDGCTLWIGTYARGVITYDTRSGSKKYYNHISSDPHSLDGSSSYAIFRNNDGSVYVATTTGINRYDRETDSFIRVRTLGATTVDIDRDPQGRIWFSTYGKGLFSYNPAADIWKNYRYSDKPGSILHNHVNCLTIDSRGTYWVGTAHGLCRFVPETDSFEPAENFPEGVNAASIIEDQDILWVGTDRGLVRYVPGVSSMTYTDQDGLPGNQFMASAQLITPSGKIYLGTTSGVCAFYPYRIKPNTYEAPILFTGVEIGNHPVEAGDPRMPEEINLTEQITLYPGDGSISVSFTSLSYANPTRNSYFYRLDGFDNEWIASGNTNKATYTNLSPGRYRLRVKGTNSDGVEGQEASLFIRVLPPWYMSLPMKLLYAALFLLAIYLIYRYLIRRSEKSHQSEIEHIKANREREVFQAKLNFFTVIAHEVRTPVSLIIAPLEKIMQTREAMSPALRDDLNIIQRNSQRLLFLINQLLDFKKVEQNGFTMHFRPTDINALLNGIMERFRPSIERKGGRLTSDIPDETLVADIDSEAITKLVSNLLNNARKYMTDEVRLSLRVNAADHTFSISVTDNGNGISPENREKIFKPFYQINDALSPAKEGTGLGLSIVRSMATAHKGTVTVDSCPGEYSTFTATLPVHQDEIYTPEEEPVKESTPAAGTDNPQREERPVLLIADDNEEMLSFIATNFRNDYEVLTATDGIEAYEILRSRQVDFIVCDWMMPRMDGIEFCRKVRSDMNFSHIPFVLLTAKTDTYSRIEGMKGGADIYIEKPFSVEYLKTCLQNISDMRTRLRQKFSQSPFEPITTVASTPVDNDFLVQLNEIIEANFSNQELSVDFLATASGISRSSLYAKIKSLTSMTPNELIQVTRLKKAAVLLAEGKYRVSEIGYMVGFNSSSYFAKCFKNQFGVKPGEFAGRKETTPQV